MNTQKLATVLWSVIAWLSLSAPYLASADAIDNNLTVNTASYLGGDGNDSAGGVEIAPDNSIVIGGHYPNLAATQRLELPDYPAERGAVLRLNAQGQLLSSTLIGQSVNDLDLNRNTGEIALVGNFGVASLTADASQVRWFHPLGDEAKRVAVADDGSVAALVRNRVNLYTASGEPLAPEFTVAGAEAKQVIDIAIHSPSQSVFVVGYRQATSKLQVPYLRSYDYAGNRKWQAYGFAANAVNEAKLGADTRGQRIAIGRDGLLYFAGKTDGGNNVFTRNPFNISETANNINIDNYTNTSNISSGSFGYFARFQATDGTHLQGQYVLTRKQSDGYKGNSFGINAITADENSTVYLGGGAFFALPCRTADIVQDKRLCPSANPLQINGQTVGNYTSNEGAVIAISADFKQRQLVAVWNGAGQVSSSPVRGVAAAQGVRAMVATAKGSLLTVNPLQNSLNGEQDMFFSIWQGGHSGATLSQLRFNALQSRYAVGERLSVSLTEEGDRTETVDAWVGLIYRGQLLFLTATGALSPQPQAWRTGIPPEVKQHQVFDISVPSGASGQYGLYAILTTAGATVDVNDLTPSLRSSLAEAVTDLD